MFKLQKTSQKSKARLGILKTRRGSIKTPFFMPIATKAAVKSLSIEDIKDLKPQILLSNTYHLMLKPGTALLKKAKGLHEFMRWDGPILTDSGGFQVFSLGLRNRSSGAGQRQGTEQPVINGKEPGGHSGLIKITTDGVEFCSHIDGSKHFMTPEDSLKIQEEIGSDIRMVLDLCSEYPCPKKQAEKDVELTLHWAERSKKYIGKTIYEPLSKEAAQIEHGSESKPLTLAIVQGSKFRDLRKKCAQALAGLDFDGYAIGGVSVGEPKEFMYQAIEDAEPYLPAKKPRYLMGVGYPHQIVSAVKRGIDMFDCVIPTREARHGRLYQFVSASLRGKAFYKPVIITKAKYKKDFNPINPNSKIKVLREYSKSYLRHLFDTAEPLALTIATLNNLEFYLDLMRKIREDIKHGKL